MNTIFLCAQCATQVVWPEELKPAEKQPYSKQPCKLCGRNCYGTLYKLKGDEKDA